MTLFNEKVTTWLGPDPYYSAEEWINKAIEEKKGEKKDRGICYIGLLQRDEFNGFKETLSNGLESGMTGDELEGKLKDVLKRGVARIGRGTVESNYRTYCLSRCFNPRYERDEDACAIAIEDETKEVRLPGTLVTYEKREDKDMRYKIDWYERDTQIPGYEDDPDKSTTFDTLDNAVKFSNKLVDEMKYHKHIRFQLGLITEVKDTYYPDEKKVKNKKQVANVVELLSVKEI
jgi:hypothetical protein